MGTWAYRTTGTPLLDQGSIQIERQDERLTATVRDTRRGRLRARVNVRDDRMELRLDDVVISGRLEDGRYQATVELATWDVRAGRSMAPSSQWAREARGSLVAHRQDTGPREATPSERCRPLLRESSYLCSPLRP
jgi:hypothetical protein